MNTHVTLSSEQPDIDCAKLFLNELLGPIAPITVRLIWQKSSPPQGSNTHTFINPTEADWWEISLLNCQGYGVFFFVNELDSTGGTSDSNAVSIRSNFVDLDNITTERDAANQICAEMLPSLVVESSDGKFHIYFRFPHHTNNALFRLIQQKLAARYGGDRSICNPAQIIRLPGFLHQKGQPFLSRWCQVTGGQDTTSEALAVALQGVHVAEGVNGARQPLGTLMQAPSQQWLRSALDGIDPNDLGREEWRRVYWAVMQAGWTVCNREELQQLLGDWCARYTRQWASGEGQGNSPDDNKGVWINGEKNGTSTGLPTILNATDEVTRKELEKELRQFDPYAAFGMVQIPIAINNERHIDFLDCSTTLNTHGKPVSQEVYRFLRDNNFPIGFDEFKQRTVAQQRLPWEKVAANKYPRNWTDTDDAFLKAFVQSSPGMARIADNQVQDGLKMYVDRNKFNPITDYLDGLQWDGTPRLDQIFTHYFSAKNFEFARMTGSKFLIGMVARAFRPGCKRDEMPIFESVQGARKSSALNIIAGDEYFSDGLPNLNDKDAMQHLAGLWLIEIGELSALRKSKVEEVKRFITARIDKFRPSFGRNIVDRPRTVVFAGTTNNDTYLKDPTGARRFWPITCGQIDLEGLRRDRDQLFAEAVVRYRAGERWWLEGDAENDLAKGETDDRREVDPWHDQVVRFATSWAVFGAAPTMQAIMEHGLGITNPNMQDRKTTSRIAAILTAEGYERTRGKADHTGKRPWVYVKK